MLLPTPEQVLAAKADAAKRFGRDEVLLIRCPAPIDFCGLFAPLDLDTYCTLADEQAADVDTGNRNAVYRQRVWPSQDAVAEKLKRRPAFAEQVVRELRKRAGYMPGNSAVELLPDMLTRAAADAEVIPGLSRAAAEKLIKDGADDELWAIVGPGPLSCVMATPDGDVWLAAKTKSTEAAVRTNKRVVRSGLDFVLQAIRWSSEPLEESLLADKPALSYDLQRAYETIGGSGADATSKSL